MDGDTPVSQIGFDEIGDGTGNEILVAGALFAFLTSRAGVVDVTIPDDAPNAVEFGLDFMRSRYRATITQVPEQGEDTNAEVP